MYAINKVFMQIDLGNIKNIIFDLGGVLVNIDYTLTTEAFKQLSPRLGSNIDAVYSANHNKDVFEALETGKITPETFRERLKQQLPPHITDTHIDNAWNAMLLNFPTERIELLKVLSKKYRIFLLSNTNAIHIAAFYDYMRKTNQLDTFLSVFEKIYYSHEIKMRKPTTEIFEYVLNENNLAPQETLFIDDSKEHTEGAKQTGIHAIWLQKPNTVMDVFNNG